MIFHKAPNKRAYIPKANTHAYFRIISMNCSGLNSRRSSKISADVIESPKSVIFDQSENRLHSAKGILLELLTKK